MIAARRSSRPKRIGRALVRSKPHCCTPSMLMQKVAQSYKSTKKLHLLQLTAWSISAQLWSHVSQDKGLRGASATEGSQMDK